MHQSLHDSPGPVSPVLHPSWKAIFIAWIGFVLGPVAVMFLISHPLVGVGIAIGVVLSMLVQKVREGHTHVSRGVTANASRLTTDGGERRDAGGSGSDRDRS